MNDFYCLRQLKRFIRGQGTVYVFSSKHSLKIDLKKGSRNRTVEDSIP